MFSRLLPKIAAREGEIFPLHVGDTWMEPFEGGRMEDLRVTAHPGMHRYTSPQGHPALLDAVVDKVRHRNGLQAERGSVLITAGATGGLGAAVGMLAAEGEEVLVLAPFWPLIRGIISTFRATPVEVPFYGIVDSPEAAVEAIRAHLSPRAVALYVSSPSNPTGQVLPEAWLAAIAELAREENLWLLSDEVYEDYVYRGEHHSIGRFAPERTFTAFSFSKAYGMAGNRTGYLVGPEDAMKSCRKISTHTFYSAPTAGQLAGLAALREGQAWVDAARDSYRAAGDDAADVLGVDRPQGSTFLFLDVRDQLDERGVFGFLEDALDDGLVMAPGPSFGQHCAGHVRLCYTSAHPSRVGEAARLLARRLGRPLEESSR
ncbi:MAG: pyridoxal phosphate-dependent aminotransferase [Alphaproteobacteria bacterium]|nr:pyridoxal phosphate-dependent aminotransferase [Alphaproteobacteria bacterium]MCB9792100.1 pyridoxal phosphate-dependent aminotransferase [Alphaproteobacteria bacterium]